jgi:hypothetical protein
MLSNIEILNNLEESIRTKKDTTMTLCPFLYFINVCYRSAPTQEKIWDFLFRPL